MTRRGEAIGVRLGGFWGSIGGGLHGCLDAGVSSDEARGLWPEMWAGNLGAGLASSGVRGFYQSCGLVI